MNPLLPSAAEMQKILDSIDKAVYDCGDAVQNALGSSDVQKMVEYLTDWTPKWMWEETFTLDQIPQKVGTDEIRNYISQLEADNAKMREALQGLLHDAVGEYMNKTKGIGDPSKVKVLDEALSLPL